MEFTTPIGGTKMDKDTGNKNPPGEGSKIDIAKLAKDAGIPEKYLKSRLTGDETMEEAMSKTVKIAYDAAQKITEQGNLLSQKDQELDKFVNSTLDLDSVGKKDSKTVNLDSKGVDEVVEMLKKADSINQKIEAGEKKLVELEAKISETDSRAHGVTSQYLGRIQKQQYKEGYQELVRRLGEEKAGKYFDLEVPDKTPIGIVLSGKIEGEREKVWAKGVKTKALSTENPIESVFRDIASPEDLTEYFNNQPPQTEGAGTRSQSGKTSESAVQEKAAKFFNVDVNK